MPPPRRMSSIVWMDLEMTGLDVEKDRIMEMACLITDNSLNIIAEGPHLIINQPSTLLESMNEWCMNTHTKVCKFIFISKLPVAIYFLVFYILYRLDYWMRAKNQQLQSIKQKNKC